ncbi:deoxynucleoside kinase [Mollicutes bacterium LVI A0078]|nr:deoxynucleoside kinase [Mollicutes bacterium LVI A0075]WOO90095.1 deoxynucleoside kinase [Mollicutes bacterium LVI A0078]
MNKNIQISISGNVGVGKSTLTKNLKETFSKAKLYEESMDEQLLDLFYKSLDDNKGIEKIELANQIAFFNGTIIRTYLGYFYEEDYHILDRPFTDHVEAFAYQNLSEEEYFQFRDYAKQTKKLLNIEPEGLIILLRGSDDVVINRIQERGRDYENTESNYDYFKELNQIYNSDRFANELAQECKKLVIINTDSNTSEDTLKTVLEEVQKFEEEQGL